MALHNMGVTLVMSILLVLCVVAAGESSSVDMGPALKYWEKKLPGLAVPALLRQAVSPVEGSALANLFAMQIQHGTVYPSTSASFCKMAGLVCENENVHSGHHQEAVGTRTQLDEAAYSYKGDPAAYSYKGDQAAYSYKGDQAAYSYKGDQAAYSYKGDQAAYSYKGDQAAYSYKGDQAAYDYKDGKAAYDYKGDEASKNQDTPSKGYFLETDLVEGATLRLKEQPAIQPRPFVPRVVADALPPLTPENLVKLQRIFDIKEGTDIYDALDFATAVCDNGTALEGEERICPASFESVVDFLSSHVGPDAKVLTSSPRPRVVMGPMKVNNFTVHHSVVDKLNVVICHILNFPSQMYMCHSVPDTKVVEASLTDADGLMIRAVGVCHLDTKMWSPGHQSFRILGTQPGITVCHWVAQESLAWVSTKSKESSIIQEAVAHGGHMAMDTRLGHDMGM